MVTRDGLILMKQQDWQALEGQRQRLERKLKAAEDFAENGCTDELDYHRASERISELEFELSSIDRALKELENWLIDHDAPGWVAT